MTTLTIKELDDNSHRVNKLCHNYIQAYNAYHMPDDDPIASEVEERLDDLRCAYNDLEEGMEIE
mgnify:CR=1 FL=1